MDAFRIIEARYRDRLLDGRSAARTGGRWNPRGLPAVYASFSISLAILEVLNQQDIDPLDSWFLGILDVASPPLAHLDRQQLPEHWRDFPLLTQAIGSRWLEHGAVGLIVPSVIHDYEDNLVLNPKNPDFSRVTVRSCEPLFGFDRLSKGRYREVTAQGMR